MVGSPWEKTSLLAGYDVVMGFLSGEVVFGCQTCGLLWPEVLISEVPELAAWYLSWKVGH